MATFAFRELVFPRLAHLVTSVPKLQVPPTSMSVYKIPTENHAQVVHLVTLLETQILVPSVALVELVTSVPQVVHMRKNVQSEPTQLQLI
jgi:hypothetical protein